MQAIEGATFDGLRFIAHDNATETAQRTTTPPGGAVVVGLDGGYVRSRHRQEERHFEVIAGKVIDAAGTQHRFTFARNGQAASADAFAQALAAAGVHTDTPATVLCEWRCRVMAATARGAAGSHGRARLVARRDSF
jgi:hypothetical protein